MFKKVFLLLWFFVLWVVLSTGSTCWAATTVPTPQQDSVRLEAIFNELSTNNQILLQSNTASALDLIAALKEVKQLRLEVQELKELSVRLRAGSMQIEADLTSNNDLLKKANQLLAAEQKAINHKLSEMRRDRTMGYIGAGLAVAAVYYLESKNK